MAFSIELYTCGDDPKTINKTFTLVSTLQADFRENVSQSLKTPSLIIDINELPNFNYVKIPSFSRSYFVTTPPSPFSSSLWIIDLREDVLESFKTQILNLTPVVDRQEHIFDLYLKDERLQVTTKTLTDYIKFNTTFNHPVISIVNSIRGVVDTTSTSE